MSGSSKVRRPATLASLAAELGVSRTTVSNAYNRPDQLSAPLRERVLEAARRLGYPGPDPVARSLRTRRAGAVGLLLTEALSYAFRDPVATGFLEGLALACERAGQGLLLVPVSPEHADVAAVHRAGVDGFVVYSVREDDPHFLAVLERPVPTVVCDQPAGVEGVDRVGRRRPRAMLGLARHLTGLGHRRVGVICMRLARSRTTVGCRPRGRPTSPTRCSATGSPGCATASPRSASTGRACRSGSDSTTRSRRASRPRPSCSRRTRSSPRSSAPRTSSPSARCATPPHRGLTVPDDLTITGFDGVPEAERAGLTTVRQPVLEKGRAAGELLLERGDRSRPRRITLPTELRVGRTSCAPRDAERWFSGL